MKFTAITVVITLFAGTDPVCTQPDITSLVPVGKILTFNCSFEYRGRWAPTIKWFDVDNVTVIASNNTGTVNRSVIHAITVPATVGMHEKTIRAHVFFEAPLMPPPMVYPRDGDATNLPDYNYHFESETIMVACK